MSSVWYLRRTINTVDDGCDYLIGSVHYMKIGEEYVPVDRSAKTLIDAAARHFGGDIYSLAEIYYSTHRKSVGTPTR